MIFFIEPRAENSLLNMQTYKRQDHIFFIYLFSHKLILARYQIRVMRWRNRKIPNR